MKSSAEREGHVGQRRSGREAGARDSVAASTPLVVVDSVGAWPREGAAPAPPRGERGRVGGVALRMEG